MQPLGVLSLLLLAKVTAAGSSQKPRSHSSSVSISRSLGPCQACRVVVTSFDNGLERTANLPPPTQIPDTKASNVTNTTTFTSSPSLSKEHKSELPRFEEIIKSLCSDVKAGKEQCAELVVTHSNLLQEWFLLPETTRPDLLTWLCIDKLQVCCPANHYGPNCTPCEGYPDNICSGHGKCKGNGTRKGNGDCLCNNGYFGPNCNVCAKQYYEAYRDDTKLICSQCHRACAGGCSGAGTKHCKACNEGWETDDERGCYDVNECLMLEKSCEKNEFCVNTEGSYSCFDCDRSCDGCYGDGPDMCDSCALGYTLIDKLCIDNSSKLRDTTVDITRYLTYFGLCVSTCIIFQKNMMIASFLGVAVGMYIALSEYLLNEQF